MLSCCGLGFGAKDIRAQFVTRDAGNPLNLENPVGRHPLPRIKGLVFDAEFGGEGHETTDLACRFFYDLDHSSNVGNGYVSVNCLRRCFFGKR